MDHIFCRVQVRVLRTLDDGTNFVDQIFNPTDDPPQA
jgi:hypothetical protein